MKRKLVKHGEATLMVSVPSKWIKQKNLGKGDEVDIIESDGNLVVSTERKYKKKEKEITFSSETESSLRMVIANAYRSGYEKLVVRFENDKQLSMIKEVVEKHLLGFEVIKEDKSSCIIENITEPSIEQFDNIFSKVLINIESLLDSVAQYLNGKTSDFEKTEEKIIEFDNFCRRVIYRQGNLEGQQLRWAFHTALNHGQRELYQLLVFLKKNKVKETKELGDLLEKVREVFTLLKSAYYEKSQKTINKIHLIEKNFIYTKGYELLKKSNEPIVIHHLLNSLRNFYLATSPLGGMLI
ncbi:MAG: hypothetical protein AABY05_03185 [Nanoarchaeota archaeon]